LRKSAAKSAENRGCGGMALANLSSSHHACSGWRRAANARSLPRRHDEISIDIAGRLRSAASYSASRAQTKWDLPAAYRRTTTTPKNLVQFANDVEKASGGKLKITVHANASLFQGA